MKRRNAVRVTYYVSPEINELFSKIAEENKLNKCRWLEEQMRKYIGLHGTDDVNCNKK